MCQQGAADLALGSPWMCQGKLHKHARLSSSLTDIHYGSQIDILVQKPNKPRITKLWLAAWSFLATPGSSTNLGECSTLLASEILAINYVGDDGREVSTTALHIRRQGRLRKEVPDLQISLGLRNSNLMHAKLPPHCVLGPQRQRACSGTAAQPGTEGGTDGGKIVRKLNPIRDALYLFGNCDHVQRASSFLLTVGLRTSKFTGAEHAVVASIVKMRRCGSRTHNLISSSHKSYADVRFLQLRVPDVVRGPTPRQAADVPGSRSPSLLRCPNDMTPAIDVTTLDTVTSKFKLRGEVPGPTALVPGDC
ncbi:hypothetical protein DFH09DRAFT_1084466 [Mycena vulgaris]|nr:hypothetical protein DFH09DRAFT_1084466 [Mycena vulgaris]